MLWGIKGEELLADEVGKEEQEIETCLLQSIILCRHILRQARRQQRPAASDLMMCQSPKGQHGPDLYPRRWWDAGSLQTTLLPSDVTCAKWNFMFAEHEQPVPITVPGKSKQTQQNQQNLTLLPADGHASGTFRLQVSQNEERTGRAMAKLLFGLIRQKLLMHSVEWGVGREWCYCVVSRAEKQLAQHLQCERGTRPERNVSLEGMDGERGRKAGIGPWLSALKGECERRLWLLGTSSPAWQPWKRSWAECLSIPLNVSCFVFLCFFGDDALILAQHAFLCFSAIICKISVGMDDSLCSIFTLCPLQLIWLYSLCLGQLNPYGQYGKSDLYLDNRQQW